MKKILESTDSDIIFLQEVVGENSRRKIYHPQYEQLADSLWTEYAYAKNSIYEKGHHGNALLSKFPIIEWWQKDISTNRLEQRGILYGKVELPQVSKNLHLFCLHLDLLQRGRDKQLVKVMNQIAKIPSSEAIVVAGDFNDWNLNLGKKIEGDLGLKECALNFHGFYLKTFPSFMPVFSLDRIYTRGLEVRNVKTLKNKEFAILSDHLPIQCELEIE